MYHSLPKAARARMEFQCSNCGVTSNSMLVCGSCKIARYCNEECQRKSWPEHKTCCAIIKAQRGHHAVTADVYKKELEVLRSMYLHSRFANVRN